MRTRACKHTHAHSRHHAHGRTLVSTRARPMRARTHAGAHARLRRLLVCAPPTGTPAAVLTTEPTAAPTGDYRHLRRGSRILVDWMAAGSTAPSSSHGTRRASLSHQTSRRASLPHEASRQASLLSHTGDTTTPADSSEPQTVALDPLHPLFSEPTPSVPPSPRPALRPQEAMKEPPSDAPRREALLKIRSTQNGRRHSPQLGTTGTGPRSDAPSDTIVELSILMPSANCEHSVDFVLRNPT